MIRDLSLLTWTNLILGIMIVTSFMGFIGVLDPTALWVERSLFFSGKYYVLISNNFVHSGIEHLFVNSIIIYVFGNLLEEKIGGIRTIILFVVPAAVTGLAWIAFTSEPALGASDSAFALMAGSLLLAPRSRITSNLPYINSLTARRPLSNFITVLGISTLIQLLFLGEVFTGLTFLDQLAGLASYFDLFSQITMNLSNITVNNEVSHLSHVVGFFSGIILAYILNKERSLYNAKLSGIFGLFYLMMYSRISGRLALVGILGMFALTLYMDPEKEIDQAEE
jgi:membrane associated rhomboid family serine protease